MAVEYRAKHRVAEKERDSAMQELESLRQMLGVAEERPSTPQKPPRKKIRP